MKAAITQAVIDKLKITGKQYDVRDAKLSGFLIRVTATGKMRYVCQYQRGRRTNVGDVGVITPAQARERAKIILGNAAQGIYPNSPAQTLTLRRFIERDYAPWAASHRRTGITAVNEIKRAFFADFADCPIGVLDALQIEKWRSARLKATRCKPATVNRYTARLKAALSKAVEWDLLENHPLQKVKLLKEDLSAKVRYLTPVEEKRLRQALETREARLREQRASANAWRQARGYEPLPDLDGQHFVDYIKPMVLLSINTGLRQGEVFHLTWGQINVEKRLLTVLGEKAKSGKTRHVSLNSEALAALKAWHKSISMNKIPTENSIVFPNAAGEPLDNVKKSWASLLKLADINDFRWHDLRHHFASKLVTRGVDLNTVRELLGHSTIQMTLRYAHLAPEHKAKAVEKLVDNTDFVTQVDE